MLAFMRQEVLDKTNVVAVYDNTCLLGILLNRSCVKLGIGDAIGSDWTEAADGANFVQVPTATYPSYY